jgi:predicted dehydrogenase
MGFSGPVSPATKRIQERGRATVGIVGTGAISEIYFEAAASSPLLDLVACSARSVASARATAERHGAVPLVLDDLLADPEIDVVLNLTGLPQHFAINRAALMAGKHVYSEKPLAGTYAEAGELLELAADRELRVGCAPDTLLGGGHQAAKVVIDSGRIGTPVAATAFLGLRAVEQFVPDPVAYFAWDAAVLDIGPYYVTQLVTMLGPVDSVVARGIVGQAGRDYPVGVPTTVSAILGFESGAQASLTLSLDAWQHSHPPLEIYGSLGTLALPDPNFFGGEPRVSVGTGPWEFVSLGDRPWSADNFELPFGTFANYRGAGLEDLVEAIIDDRPHRATGELAAHVLDVLERILVSVRSAA